MASRTPLQPLGRLRLSATSAVAGQDFTAEIAGRTTGSELILVDSCRGRFTLTGTTLAGTKLRRGKMTPVIRELPGTSGALGPRDTEFMIDVAHDPTIPAFALPGGVTPSPPPFSPADLAPDLALLAGGAGMTGAYGTTRTATAQGGAAVLSGVGPQLPADTGSPDLLSGAASYAALSAAHVIPAGWAYTIVIGYAPDSTTASRGLVGRSGQASSYVQLANGAAGVAFRPDGGTLQTAPLTLAHAAATFGIVELQVDAAGVGKARLNDAAWGAATAAAGAGGMTLDQIGRINATATLNGKVAFLYVFHRMLTDAEALSLRTFHAACLGRFTYAAAAGSDASATPWNKSTPFASLEKMAGLRVGDTLAARMTDVFRPTPGLTIPAGVTLDGGLWGGAYDAGPYGTLYDPVTGTGYPTASVTNGADLRFSTAPALTLVDGTTYSFARTNAPKGYVFHLNPATGALLTRLKQTAGTQTAPGPGEWGFAAGTVYVDAGTALAAGAIEASVETSQDAVLTTGAAPTLRRFRIRFSHVSGLSNGGTNVTVDRVLAEANLDDGLDCSGAATTVTFLGCGARWNGNTPASGSGGDGYSQHGTSAAVYLGCFGVDNDRTQWRHLVTTTSEHRGCLAIGRQPFTVVPQAGTPSANGMSVIGCVAVALPTNVDGTPAYGAFNNNAGPMKVYASTFYVAGPAADSVAIRADTSGGTMDVRGNVLKGFQTGLHASGGAAITENHNLIAVTNAARNGVAAGANSLTGEPLLVDPAAVPVPNTRPAAGSPAIGAGVAIGGVVRDFYGLPRPSPPSVGAAEQVSL